MEGVDSERGVETPFRLLLAVIGISVALMATGSVAVRLGHSSLARAAIVNLASLAILAALLDARVPTPTETRFACSFALLRLLTFVGDRAFVTDGAFDAFRRHPRRALRDAIGAIPSDEAVRFLTIATIELSLLRAVGVVARSASDLAAGTVRCLEVCLGATVTFLLSTFLRDRYVYADSAQAARAEPFVLPVAIASTGLGAVLTPSSFVALSSLGAVLALLGVRLLPPLSGAGEGPPAAAAGKAVLVGTTVALFAANALMGRAPPSLASAVLVATFALGVAAL